MRQSFGCVALAAACAVGCSSSAQELIAVDLRLSGSQPEPVDLKGGGTIDLTEASLAVGPLYLCAGAQSGELCESARLQWLESAVVDALEEKPKTVGTLEGLSGNVRSWMYDHGFTSTRSHAKPIELSAATELGHNSVRLVGTVQQGTQLIPFQAEFPITLSDEVEPGFSVVRSSRSVNLEFSEETKSLELQFQTKSWLAALRLDDFYQELDCDEVKLVTCQGLVEQRCDESGALVEETDCAGRDQICAPFAGCGDSVELLAGSRAVRSLEQEIVAGTRPAFRVK